MANEVLYCVRSDVEAIFGTANVAVWADLNSNKIAAEITARISNAIDWATSEVNDLLRGGPYSLPVVSTDGTVPKSIVDTAAMLAGVWLYESRGIVDYNSEGKAEHRLQHQRNRAYDNIRQIHAGQRKLNAIAICSAVPSAYVEHKMKKLDDKKWPRDEPVWHTGDHKL